MCENYSRVETIWGITICSVRNLPDQALNLKQLEDFLSKALAVYTVLRINSVSCFSGATASKLSSNQNSKYPANKIGRKFGKPVLSRALESFPKKRKRPRLKKLWQYYFFRYCQSSTHTKKNWPKMSDFFCVCEMKKPVEILLQRFRK